jgi:hypothetical protein
MQTSFIGSFYGHVLSEQWGSEGIGSRIPGIVLRSLLSSLASPFGLVILFCCPVLKHLLYDETGVKDIL